MLFLAVSLFGGLAMNMSCGSSGDSGDKGGTQTSAPTITTQPADLSVTVGQVATFTVAAQGTAPLHYQWQKGTANIGTDAAAFSIPSAQAGDADTYAVTITNGVGSVTSRAATLTVSPAPIAPAITQQPASQAVAVGAPVTLTVVATGTAPLHYQWKK